MTNTEFNDAFTEQVRKLTFEKQLQLCILVCKKLFPDYSSFSIENRWGEPTRLLDTINFIEKSGSAPADSKKIKSMMSKIHQITPDTEDFPDCSFALNSCVAIYCTLELILNRDPQSAEAVGTAYTDTIDFKIQEEKELTQEEIDLHPEMISARQFLLETS